jgi:L-fucose mutarotase
VLSGIKPCISPDLLYTLARMGHGDELVLVDAFYPAHSRNPNVIRCDGSDVCELLDGILSLMNLDNYVADPVTTMEAANGDTLDPSMESDFRAAIDRHWPDTPPIAKMERHDFMARSTRAFAIVQTGETRKYANIIIKKGVIPPQAADAASSL